MVSMHDEPISTSGTVLPIDYIFVGALIVFVLLDTIILLWLVQQPKLNEAVLAVLAAFMTANTTTPIGIWVGYRYGSSQGSKVKDETIAAIAKTAP